MQDAIRVENLSKRYKSKKGMPGFEIKDVSFTVPTGSIVGFIGENGAGKTTTIKLILNTLKKNGGKVEVFGMDNEHHEKEIKSRVGVVLSGNHFPDSLTIKQIENIHAAAYPTWDHTAFSSYLEFFGFRNPKSTVKKLSHGMRARLAIAVAMSHHADLLLLDEPTSGLDPVVRSEILEILADYTSDENKTVLFSSHITSDIEKIADYIIFIQDGSIVLAEETNLLLEQYALVKCGEDVFAQVDADSVVGYRNHRFGYELLTQDADIVKGLNGEYTIEKPTIEDIMVFHTMR